MALVADGAAHFTVSAGRAPTLVQGEPGRAIATAPEQQTHLVVTMTTAVIIVVVIFVFAFLFGLWCGWMWRRRRGMRW